MNLSFIGQDNLCALHLLLKDFKCALLVGISEVRIQIYDDIQHQIYTLWGYVPQAKKAQHP